MATMNAVKVKLRGGPLDGAEASLALPLPKVHGFGKSIAELRVGALERGRPCAQWVYAAYSARVATYARVGDERAYEYIA